MPRISCWFNHFWLFLIATASELGAAPTLPEESALRRQTNRTSEPCAILHDFLAVGIPDGDLAPANVNTPIPAEMAYLCAKSAPLIKADALRLLDVVMALLEWHSTLAYLKNPPPGYLLSATDIVGDARALRLAVQNDIFTSELAFQQNLTSVLSSAHDGHLHANWDVMSVFAYVRNFDDIVSVSLNGKAIPEIFALHDLYKRHIDGSFVPSPITMINGEDAQSWILHQALNTSSHQHDPDAMFNTFVKSPGTGGGFSLCGDYPGPNTTVGFKNGTVMRYHAKAVLLQDFSGVVDGETFYHTFATGDAPKRQNSKRTIAGLDTVHDTGVIATSATSMASYPIPLFWTDDSAISGYFMETPGFESVAILTLRSFAPTDIQSFQSNLTEFLQSCVLHGKRHLVLEMQGNPGGNIGLGYDVFKQLFPDIEPYAAGNQRSHDQPSVMGEFITQLAHDALKDTGSIKNYTAAGGYSIFDARASINVSGQNFDSWDEFSGPVPAHGDNFTNLSLPDIGNTGFEQYITGITFGDPPIQPFQRENIIVLADGDCASTCDTFMHLLKWDAKVKTIVGGGRPQPGPMQFVGGVKARHKLSIGYLMYLVNIFRDKAPPEIQARANATQLKAIFESGDYLSRRTEGEFSVNLGNAIVKGDKTLTPLQFVYEAADCRVWWRPEHFFDVQTLWALVAGTAFGLNDTEMWSACVEGSTNHPSSVTGGGVLVFDSTLDPASNNASRPGGSEDGNSTGAGAGADSGSAVGKADPQGGGGGGATQNSADTAGAYPMISWPTALVLILANILAALLL